VAGVGAIVNFYYHDQVETSRRFDEYGTTIIAMSLEREYMLTFEVAWFQRYK